MFYIFHGENTHSAWETLDKIKAKIGDLDMLSLNTTRLDGKGLRVNNLMDACNAMPFLAPKRLIIVENYFNSKPDGKEVDKLLNYLETIPDSARLFFIENKALKSNSKVIKLAEKEGVSGVVRKFEPMAGPKLEQWIMKRAEQKEGKMHPAAARMLAANAGNDLTLLDNEIEKMVVYKLSENDGELAEITVKDVQLLSPHIAEVNIFDLVDALGNRNGARAALLLQQKLNEGAEPFLIFSMFVRQFRMMIQVKELAGLNMRPPEISKETKFHSFVVGKVLNQTKSFSMKQLEQIYAHLLDIDLRVKTGKGDIVTSLNMLVFNLT
ncbi:MAG: DNA polymerase-3 subunit delta [Cellvibrionaceae bacterium]|jgi:DNA polymerase-3 subunit delta